MTTLRRIKGKAAWTKVSAKSADIKKPEKALQADKVGELVRSA